MTLPKPKTKTVQLNTAISEQVNKDMRELIDTENIKIRDFLELGIELAIKEIRKNKKKENNHVIE